jgi:regulator of sigma E protease
MLTAGVFLLVLMSAVLIHELAHYVNARSIGLPVRAFSIGMGPVIARFRWRGTEWRISLLPLGGYVDLPGMAPKVADDGRLEHPDEGLAVRPLHHKLWVLVGGVVANYVLGIVLLATAVTLAPGYREIVSGTAPEVSGAVVVDVGAGSIAESLGIRPGDRLVEIGAVSEPTPAQAVEAIQSAEGLSLLLEGEDGARRRVSAPWPPAGLAPDERPLLGVQLAPVAVEPVAFGTALVESAAFGVRLFPDMVAGFVRGFGSALTGGENQDVAGPVGIVTMVGQAAQVGLAPVLLLAALINFSLAVFNLLPIPGLDGGRMLLATVVALRGRPFRPGQEEMLHFIGIATVLLLIVLITVQEIGGLLRG